MDYLKEYQKWLDSGVLTAEEHAELEAIKDDPKEIEGRFYGPLEFGTAGLRGTMAMGLHHMNIYVVRHATQGFANVICAEGEKAKERGVAIAMDCRLHGMEFAYGKLMECAGRLVGERLARMTVIAVIAVIVVFILAYRKWAEVKQIYKVTLTEQGEHAIYRALFDTGNLLTDPVTGKPVSVVEETEETKKWLEKYPEKYKIIPYRSVGNEHGLLEGLVVDEMIIQKEKEQVVKKGAVIALYKGKLSKNGDFQMILNHSLIG